MLGTTELIIVLFMVVLVFGASKIPQLGEALGKGIRNFKRATGDEQPQPQLPDSAAKERGTAEVTRP